MPTLVYSEFVGETGGSITFKHVSHYGGSHPTVFLLQKWYVITQVLYLTP